MIKIVPFIINNEDLIKNIASKKNGRNKKKCDHCGKEYTTECDSCDNYDNRALMKSELGYVLNRYKFYENNISNLNSIKEENKLTGYTKTLFINAYKGSSDFQIARKNLLENMPNVVKAKCPFCMISAPNTLDHYYDKDSYPEFSVYTYNLIPCCSQCNSLKGTEIFTSENIRKVLHYYYDTIPENQVFVISIKLEKNIPVFDMALNIDETKENNLILKNQFEALQLFKRYNDQLNDHVSTLIDELYDYYCEDNDMSFIITMLKTKAKSMRKKYGINYWLSCLYECLAQNSNVTKEMLESHVI